VIIRALIVFGRFCKVRATRARTSFSSSPRARHQHASPSFPSAIQLRNMKTKTRQHQQQPRALQHHHRLSRGKKGDRCYERCSFLVLLLFRALLFRALLFTLSSDSPSYSGARTRGWTKGEGSSTCIERTDTKHEREPERENEKKKETETEQRLSKRVVRDGQMIATFKHKKALTRNTQRKVQRGGAGGTPTTTTRGCADRAAAACFPTPHAKSYQLLRVGMPIASRPSRPFQA